MTWAKKVPEYEFFIGYAYLLQKNVRRIVKILPPAYYQRTKCLIFRGIDFNFVADTTKHFLYEYQFLRREISNKIETEKLTLFLCYFI